MLGGLVLLGVLSMMLLLGGIIALLEISVGSTLAVVVPLANLAVAAIGLLLVTGRNPFTRLPGVKVPALRHPYANAYAYGLLYGPIALPCAGPLVVSVFALSLSPGQFVDSLAFFLIFGLGMGMPLFILSFLARARQDALTRWFARRHVWVNRVAGVLLIAVGGWAFFVNLEFLQLFLSL